MASPFFNSAGEDEFDEEDLQYIAQSSRQGGGGAPKAKYVGKRERWPVRTIGTTHNTTFEKEGDVGAQMGAPNWSIRNQNHPRPRALVVTAKKALVQLDQIP